MNRIKINIDMSEESFKRLFSFNIENNHLNIPEVKIIDETDTKEEEIKPEVKEEVVSNAELYLDALCKKVDGSYVYVSGTIYKSNSGNESIDSKKILKTELGAFLDKYSNTAKISSVDISNISIEEQEPYILFFYRGFRTRNCDYANRIPRLYHTKELVSN